MLVLTVLKSKLMRDAVTFAFESQLDAQVIEASSTAEALEPLLQGKPVEILVCEYPDYYDSLTKFMGALNRAVPLIIYGESGWDLRSLETEPNVLGCVPESSTAIESIIAFARTYDPSARALPGGGRPETGEDHDFCRIKIDLLRGVNPLSSDLFIRLGPTKFVKIFRTGDAFEAEDRQKYLVQKEIEYLYIPKGAAPQLLRRFQTELKEMLNAPDLKPEKVEEISMLVHEAAAETIRKLGVTPEVKDLIKSNVLLSIKAMGANPRLKGVLSKLTTDREKYIPSHSVMLSHLACSIAAAMEWGSEMTFHKLTMAAFFHDILLEDHEMAQLQSKYEVEAKAGFFGKDKVRDYFLHAAKAADLVRGFGEIPPDVDLIVLQHHERPDGNGFPRGLNHKQIAPLACVFIVAHELLREMMKLEKSFELQAFIDSNKERYNVGNFRKVMTCLKIADL